MDLERPLIFLDTETTGLDPEVHEVIEIAWSVWGEDAIHELVVPHTGLNCDPTALQVNHYFDRRLWERDKWCSPDDLIALSSAFTNATVCSANVTFDIGFMDRIIGGHRHYRAFDFTSWAAGRLGWPVTRGMRTTYEHVSTLLPVSEPDHTAAGDVQSMKDMYEALLHLGSVPVS